MWNKGSKSESVITGFTILLERDSLQALPAPHLPQSDILGRGPSLTVFVHVKCVPTSNKKKKMRGKIIAKDKNF